MQGFRPLTYCMTTTSSTGSSSRFFLNLSQIHSICGNLMVWIFVRIAVFSVEFFSTLKRWQEKIYHCPQERAKIKIAKNHKSHKTLAKKVNTTFTTEFTYDVRFLRLIFSGLKFRAQFFQTFNASPQFVQLIAVFSVEISTREIL